MNVIIDKGVNKNPFWLVDLPFDLPLLKLGDHLLRTIAVNAIVVGPVP
jgi:hypothetical protein